MFWSALIPVPLAIVLLVVNGVFRLVNDDLAIGSVALLFLAILLSGYSAIAASSRGESRDRSDSNSDDEPT
jgi:hypothetical protein